MKYTRVKLPPCGGKYRIYYYSKTQNYSFQIMNHNWREKSREGRKKGDVGFYSVHCENALLPLFSKEVSFAFGSAECSKTGNPSRATGGKKAESERHDVVAEGERY